MPLFYLLQRSPQPNRTSFGTQQPGQQGQRRAPRRCRRPRRRRNPQTPAVMPGAAVFRLCCLGSPTTRCSRIMRRSGTCCASPPPLPGRWPRGRARWAGQPRAALCTCCAAAPQCPSWLRTVPGSGDSGDSRGAATPAQPALRARKARPVRCAVTCQVRIPCRLGFAISTPGCSPRTRTWRPTWPAAGAREAGWGMPTRRRPWRGLYPDPARSAPGCASVLPSLHAPAWLAATRRRVLLR